MISIKKKMAALESVAVCGGEHVVSPTLSLLLPSRSLPHKKSIWLCDLWSDVKSVWLSLASRGLGDPSSELCWIIQDFLSHPVSF